MKSARLKKIYIVIVCIVIACLAASYIILNNQLKKNTQQGQLINLAGRQRMLSQQITQLSLQLVYENNLSTSLELANSLEGWNKVQQGLSIENITSKNASLILIKPSLDKATFYCNAVVKNVHDLLDNKVDREICLDNILKNQVLFLKNIDAVVNGIASNNDYNNDLISKMIDIVILLILFFIVVEVSFIYQPVLKKIAEKERKLICKNDELEQINLVLNQTKKILESTISLSMIGGWEVDTEQNKVTWTKMTRLIHEVPEAYEPKLATGISFYKQGIHRDKIIEVVDNAVKHGQPWDIEAIIVTAKGQERWVRAKGDVEMNGDKCVKIYGSFQDIHEKKLQQIQLTESEEKYRSIIENTMYAMLLIDNDGLVVESNLAAEKLFNYNRSELCSMSISIILSQVDVDFIKKIDEADSIINKVHEMTGSKKAGSTFSCEAVANTYIDSKGLRKIIVTIKDISALKKIKREHALVEKRLQSILDNAPDSICIKDLGGRYLMVNKTYSDLIKVPENKLIGKTDEDVLPLTASLQCKKSDEIVIEQGKATEFEEEFEVDGITATLQITKFLITDTDGNTVAICRIAKDVSEKKKTAELLLDSVSSLSKLTEKVAIGIYQFRIDANGLMRFEFLSKAFEILYPGLDMEAIKISAQPFFKILHPEDVTLVTESIEKSRAALTDWNIEMRWIIKNEIKWIKGSSKPERKEDGSTVWYGFMEDITQRRKEIEQLKLMESVVENATDMVVITEAEPIDDSGPKIVYVNDAFCNITGYSKEETIGNTPRMLQGVKSDKMQLRELKSAMREWKPYTAELVNYKKNGDEFWVNFTVFPIANSNGRYTHWIAIERDVTEAKNYISSIEIKNEKLKEIAWTQSHKVRAPLAKLIGMVNVLENYPDENSNEIIQYIKDAAGDLNTIVGKIVHQSACISE